MNSNKLNRFEKFCLYCAGVDMHTISKCNSAEIHKYTVMGTMVWMPALIGMCSMAAAMDMIYGRFTLTLAAALLWGAVIFFLDRAMMSKIQSSGMTWDMIGRLCLAIVIALTVAESWAIIVFHPEIKEQLSKELKLEIDFEKGNYNQKIDDIDLRLRQAKSLVDEKEAQYIAERDGTGGTRIALDGPVTRIKKKAFQDELTRYNHLQKELAAAKKRINQQLEIELLQTHQFQAKGFLASLRAVHHIEDPYVKSALWGLRLLLLFIELIPFLIKLSSKGDHGIYLKMAVLDESAHLKAAQANHAAEVEMFKKQLSATIKLNEILAEHQHTKEQAKSFEEMLTDMNRLYQNRMRKHIEAARKIRKMTLSKAEKINALRLLNDSIDAFRMQWRSLLHITEGKAADADDEYEKYFKEVA